MYQLVHVTVVALEIQTYLVKTRMLITIKVMHSVKLILLCIDKYMAQEMVIFGISSHQSCYMYTKDVQAYPYSR